MQELAGTKHKIKCGIYILLFTINATAEFDRGGEIEKNRLLFGGNICHRNRIDVHFHCLHCGAKNKVLKFRCNLRHQS
jgi:hypothetical protein